VTLFQKLIDSGIYKVGDPLQLHLGCGSNYFKGYVNIDFPQTEHNVMQVKADVYIDIVKDLLFPTGVVDEIRSHHMLEHFSRVIALAQLVKWHSWLKVEGVLLIETPDFLGSIHQILSDNIDYKQQMSIVRHLTGDQAADWAFHRDMWWDERFETTLSKLGFHITDIKHTEWNRWPQLRNIIVTATKLDDVKLSVQIEQCLELLKESMASDREQPTFEVWKKQLLENING